VNYGLRYELNSRIKESEQRTSSAIPLTRIGNETSFLAPGARQIFLYNPQPAYAWIKNDGDHEFRWICVDETHNATCGRSDHNAAAKSVAGEFCTGGFPLTFQPVVTAVRIVWCPSAGQCLPQRYLIHIRKQGQLLFPDGDSSKVPVNTRSICSDTKMIWRRLRPDMKYNCFRQE